MTREEIEMLQKIVYAEYLNVQPDEVRTRGYQKILGHLTFSECESAVYVLMALPNRTSPVTSSEILTYIKDKNRYEPKTDTYNDDTPLERRQEIVNQMHDLFPDLFK
jgi:hypothetical protein